jgi:uncharacterized OB-fold protein
MAEAAEGSINPQRPMPDLDPAMQPFLDGLREHKLLLFRCTTCGAWYWPVAYCRFHPNQPYMAEMEWAEASGRGTVFTFNRHYTAFHPAFRELIPFVYALVQLEEGPLIGSNIVGCAPEEVSVGLPVEVEFADVPEREVTLPLFHPRRA